MMLFRLVLLCCGLVSHLSASIHSFVTPTQQFLKQLDIPDAPSGLPSVDCIYVINLDKRIQKWNRVQSLFQQYGISPQRVSGVHGWDLTQEERETLSGPYPTRLRAGHMGCLLSHLSAIADAYKKRHKTIWICEDDIEFSEHPKTIPLLLKELTQLDASWDILYTDVDTKNGQGQHIKNLSFDFRPDGQYQAPHYYLARRRRTSNLQRIGQRYGMYSYLLSRSGMKKILDYFTHVYIWTSIDIDIHYIPQIRQYATNRDIVTIWCKSGISDTVERPE